jgi:hypothetical protein
MKKLLIVCFCALPTALFLSSCDDKEQSAKGSATFSFTHSSTNAGSRVKETANKILVTIKDSGGNLVENKKEISLYNFEGEYISEPLVLGIGEYTVEEFLVLNNDNEVIYVSPIDGSELAYLVAKPLPLPFSVAQDKITQVAPEVITAEGHTAIEFGYVTFSFDVVNTLAFLSSAFVYNGTELELSSYNLLVTSGSDTLYNAPKPNSTTSTIVRSNYNSFKLLFSKAGYLSVQKEFTKEQLLNYQNSAVTAVFPDSLLNKGLVAYYTFENGKSHDLTGNGNDGEISNALPSSDRTGRTTESMKFDSSDDYIKVNNPSFLNDSMGTFVAWVKFSDLGHTQYVGSVGDENSIENYISFLRIDGTDRTIGIYQREVGMANWVKGSTVLQTNQYYHLAMTSNGSEWKIYVNGQRENLTVVGGVNNGKWISQLAGIDNFVIGSSIIQQPYNVPYLAGNIDEVRLYNRELKEPEITILYNKTR